MMLNLIRKRSIPTAIVVFVAALSIALILPERAGAYNSPTTHTHTGSVKHTILEQFNVTATETFLKTTYKQSDSQSTFNMTVHGDSRCYASAFPVWTISSCSAWVTNAWPWFQQADIEGKFSHTTQVKYTMRSYFRALGDNTVARSCWLSSGSMPPFWEAKCAVS